MKIKPLILLIFIISSLGSASQTLRPENWNEIITAPWYFGNISNKPVFLYFNPISPETAWFFVADKAIPVVHPVNIKHKNGTPRSAQFNINENKIKVKFTGSINDDSIAGYIKSSRKNAIRLGVSPSLPIFFQKESPDSLVVPSPRYHTRIFDKIGVQEDVSYGAATGYYSSLPVRTEGYDYQQIILDAMEKMYVDPTREAIVHILNQDPVAFALTDLQALRFDLFQPVGDRIRKRPLIVLLHGGAFILGDKANESIRVLAGDFVSKGYVVASINYRMGFNPASKSSLERSAYRAVQDARAALRYLSANAAEFNIDPHWVFLGGSSAGAITALNVAFMKEDERPESTERNLWRAQVDLGGLDESTNTIAGDYTIRAVINLWGAVSDTALIDAGEQIPVLSIHGNADRIVPYSVAYPFLDLDTSFTSNIVSKLYGSYPLHRRLSNLGIHSELVTLPGAGHEPMYEPGKYQAVMDTVISRASDFYFRAMFNFPEVSGPRQVAMGMSPATYSITGQDEISYFWRVTGGKRIPGSAGNTARVVWLAEEAGEVTLVLVHKNGANVEIEIPVKLP